ncbi:MAG: DUF2835 domain-containing protein [Pseudomonadota bacterium]
MTERRIVVDLDIAADEYVRVYAGTAQSVMTVAADGRSVKFPANVLRPFVTHDGVRGRFEIIYDEQGRFQRIARQ